MGERHWHVKWKEGGAERLDYYPCMSRGEAEALAIHLSRPGERWELVEFEGGCDQACPASVTRIVKLPIQEA